MSWLTSFVSDLAVDPALPEVAQLVARIETLETTPTKPGAPPSPPSSTPGVGLKYLVMPLKTYITVKQNPWLIPTVAVVGIGLPLFFAFAVGYRAGRSRGMKDAR